MKSENKKDKRILDKVIKDTNKMVMSTWKDDVQVLMPFQVAIMRSDMTKIHQNTVLLILEKIKKQLGRALNGTKQEKKELILFPEQEFGADPNVIKMRFYYKDFGVSSSNYNYLEQMLAAIPRIPVQIPVKSNTGREYRMFTNFCNVLLPKEQVAYNKYAIISMQREVADALMNFDLGYLYVGKNTSITMETKYSERMYWYIKSNLSNHGVTITTLEFRKMLGLEDKYKNFNALEKNVLETSQLEIKKKFDKDEIECYFTYDKIYNHRAKRGEPDAIKFSIYESNNNLDEKLSRVVQNQQEIISEMLKEDLGLSNVITSMIVKRVTNDNAEALQNEIIKIKMNLDFKAEDKEVVRNRTAYIVTSLNTFFTNFKKGGGKSSEETSKPEKNKDYRQGWNKVVQEMYKSLTQNDADTLFRNTKFLGYDPESGVLSVTLDKAAYDLLRGGYINKLAEYLKKYLDKNFKKIDPKKA